MIHGEASLTSKSNLDTLKKALKKMASQEVYVGIPQNKNQRKAADGDAVNNAELLYIQTNGARSPAMIAEMNSAQDAGATYSKAHALYIKSHGSPLMRIPPRPVIEPAIEANKKRIGELIGDAQKEALQGNIEAFKENLNKAGLYASNCAKDWFTNPKNGWPPNAPSTIKQKGSDRPLIDTSSMRNAITYVIRKKE